MRALITLVWLFDIFNLGNPAILDVTYPVNGWFWFIVFILGGLGFSKYSED